MSAVAKKRKTVSGAKGGQSKPKQPSIASNSVPSLATARLVYIWSWGPIVGPVDGLRSVRLDGTPIQAQDGTINYPGVKWQFRSGELHQERLAGVTESSNEIAVGQELRTSTPWLYTINNSMIDAARVRLSWPTLQSQDASGNINGVRIDYAVDVSTDNGPYVTVLTSFVDRKNVTKYERSHRIELPAGNRWTLRARRLTPEANSSLVQDSMFIEAVAELVDSDQEYPLTSVGCIEYDAQQFGGDIAKIAVLMRGRIVRVPSNYDAVTRTYATGGTGTSGGIWDGTFKEAYTNNPAWVFYDLVLHPYYGLGERIDATMVDRWSLYRIAQYCDQMVPDGKGGQEPRFTCNLYFQKQAEAYAVLQDLASIFHGMAYWDGSQIVVNADMPGDPVFSYSPSQILNNGAIKYDGTRWRDRHTTAMVSWDNPAQGFETDKEPVFDNEAMSELGSVRELSVDAFGCTSLGQAQRAGQWALVTEQLQTRGATFRVGLDGGIPKPGQIISVGDPMLAGRANGGRVSSAAGRVITLDRDVTIPTGARLFVNLPSGKSEARVISSVNGRAVTVAANYSEVPEPECGWVIDFDDLKVMQFYVRNVTRPEWHQYQLEVIQHEPSKFPFIDNGAVVDTRPISGIPIGTQEAPARVLISQNVVVEQGIAVTSMSIAWDAAPGAVAYDVEWRWGAREWIKIPRTGELMVDVRGIYSGQYLARVRAVSAMNVSSVPTNSVLTDLQGKTGLPPAVTHLTATSLLFGIALKWGFPAGAEDTQRTEIWYGPSPSREAATKLADLAYPQSDYSMQSLLAGATFFFWARLVDRTGNVGPWYPEGIGVMGQASSNAGPILDLIKGQVGETELGQDIVDKINLIPGLQDQINALDGLAAYKPDKVYEIGQMVVEDGRIYQATDEVPANTPPPNDDYWLDVGQSIEANNGLAQQVATNTVEISELDGVVTAQATAFEALRASFRDDDGEGDLADALKGWSTTAAVASESKVRASENFASAQKITTLDAKVGENEANVTDLRQVVATDREATAQALTQVSVKVGENSAAIQETSTAFANVDGKLSTMWSLKMQVTANGQYVAAGIGLGIENTGAGLQSQFLVSADRFAIVNTIAGGAIAVPFAVQDGQVFLRSAFIQDGTITNGKIGGSLSSTDYIANTQGWMLPRSGPWELNGTNGAGRLQINNTAIKLFHANGVLGIDISL
ncbi:host specificity protein J [Pseudomonas moraviensis]|uniref:host specificity protein J n=1 Tax=Pseudomonas moraviensis TaxID=321662 RepID=UPI0038115038